MDVLETLNLPSGFLEDYAINMRYLDPMRVSRMLANHERIGVLSCEAGNHPLMDMGSYLGHLGSFGVKDTIDLMFWSEGIAFGGVSFLKNENDPSHLLGPEQLLSMQRFIEASFKNHPKVKEIMFDSYLTKRCLSHREKAVVKLICEGYSNKDIANAMSITIATVKTYVNRIFEKLSIDSRTALMAQILR
jgi:DNA-binding CsgD family transcriptional regulator